MKNCFKCLNELELDLFYKNKHNKDGLDHICKYCRKKYSKNRISVKQDTHNKKSLEYYHRTKQIRKLTKKEYNKNYTRQRRKIDPCFRLQNNLRKRLTLALKTNCKKGSIINYLGCSIQEFKSYLESKFQPGMTWDNYGRGSGFWSIDHIKPLKIFNLSNEEQFKIANHYTNLQPMWFQDNCAKGKNLVKKTNRSLE